MMIHATSQKHKKTTPISRLRSDDTSRLAGPTQAAEPDRPQSQPDRSRPSKLSPVELRPWSKSISKARRKDKINGQKISLEHTKQMLETHLFTASNIGRPTERPLQPPSALKTSCEATKLLLLLLAVSVFISLVGGVLVFDDSGTEMERVTHSSRGKLKTNNIHRNRILDSDRGLERQHGPQHPHRLTSKQQDKNEQQNQLRYLIARTASIPQPDDHNQQGPPPYKPYHESHRSHARHADNNIVNYYDGQNHHHSRSVQQRTTIEPSVASATRHNQHRNLFQEQARLKTTKLDSELGSLNRPNSRYYDFDSLDIDLDDDDDDDDSDDGDNNEKATDDDDDDDDVVDDGDVDPDEDASNDVDVVREGPYDGHDDEGEGNDEDDRIGTNNSELAIHSDNDIVAKKRRTHSDQGIKRKFRGNWQEKTLYSYSEPVTATTDGHSLGTRNSTGNLNTTEGNYRSVSNDIELQSSNDQASEKPNWTNGYDDESFSESNDMVMSTIPSKHVVLSQPIGRHKGNSIQPLAPYQSPVVVSISDNSFVSASPITMGGNVDDFENSSQRRFGEATIRYSRIIASPKNELSLHAKRHWRESHIQMIQEDPDELKRSNINSAIIAILFGIGATGMLIMIVSVKMRSIRERVAYKGRRRSLVPDTDFLINTIPI